MPRSHLRRFLRAQILIPPVLVIGLAALFWPNRELGENFVFYLPTGSHTLPVETTAGAKYLPLLQVLNLVGKVGGIQEKKNTLKVFFGSTQIELRADDTRVQVAKSNVEVAQPVHLTNGQWMVPLDFLTTVLPRLTHQAVEYQEGTNRIFLGDVRPGSFTVRLDPVANGARVTVQFTDKIAVRTTSSNGKWVMFLGDHPMEPLEPVYHFQNSYISELRYDDQDGVPKLILSPTSGGLNFYPQVAEGDKTLLAEVVKATSPTAQTAPAQAGSQPPAAGQAPGASNPQNTAESPVAPPSPPLPTVALDAGHGGDDAGGRSHDGVLEKDLTAQCVARVRSALVGTAKYRVALTRTGDVNVTADQRALTANLSGAVYFLSFHAGDLGTTSPRIAIFTFETPTAVDSAAVPIPTPAFLPWQQVQRSRLGQSLPLALALQQQFALMNGLQADSPTPAPVRILRNINAAAVAIELGRFAPDTDSAGLTNPAFQQQMAGAVVQALASLDKGGN